MTVAIQRALRELDRGVNRTTPEYRRSHYILMQWVMVWMFEMAIKLRELKSGAKKEETRLAGRSLPHCAK